MNCQEHTQSWKGMLHEKETSRQWRFPRTKRYLLSCTNRTARDLFPLRSKTIQKIGPQKIHSGHGVSPAIENSVIMLTRMVAPKKSLNPKWTPFFCPQIKILTQKRFSISFFLPWKHWVCCVSASRKLSVVGRKLSVFRVMRDVSCVRSCGRSIAPGVGVCSRSVSSCCCSCAALPRWCPVHFSSSFFICSLSFFHGNNF